MFDKVFSKKTENIIKHGSDEDKIQLIKSKKVKDEVIFYFLLTESDVVTEAAIEEAKKREGIGDLILEYIEKSSDELEINRAVSLLLEMPNIKNKLMKIKNLKDQILLNLLMDEDEGISEKALRIANERSSMVDALTEIIDEVPSDLFIKKSMELLLNFDQGTDHGYYGKTFVACHEKTPVEILKKLMFSGDPTLSQIARYNYISKTKDMKALNSNEFDGDKSMSFEEIMRKNHENAERVKNERKNSNKKIIKGLNKNN